MENGKIWFITDAARGLGYILVRQLLNSGCKVAATADSINGFEKTIIDNKNFFPQAVDLTTAGSVEDAIDLAVMRFGRIDVVVNTAGYCLAGSLEELSDREVRDNFDTNVFGTLNVLRSVMMHLRAQRSGHVFTFSSAKQISDDVAGRGIHYATGLAVQGLTESLAAEAKEFGVKVTLVSPGAEFTSSGVLADPKRMIMDYSEISRRPAIKQPEGNELINIAAAIICSASGNDAPLHLSFGDDADNMDSVIKDIENRWEYFYQQN